LELLYKIPSGLSIRIAKQGRTSQAFLRFFTVDDDRIVDVTSQPMDLAAFPQAEGAASRRTAAKECQIVRANLVYVEKEGYATIHLNRLLRLAAFQSPEFYKAQAMRRSTYDKPRAIACGQEFAQHIAVLRGCLMEALALLEAHKIRSDVRDKRDASTAIEAECVLWGARL
jgi:hypothetical protein